MTTSASRRRAGAGVVAAALVVGMVPMLRTPDTPAAVPPPTVHAYGTAAKFSGPKSATNAVVVAIAPSANGKGFWSLTADGGVFTSGGARFYGAPAGAPMAGHAVDIVSTPSGRGYWIATTRGAVYAYGDARWRGSAKRERLVKPIVGIAATRTGRGYWLASSGGRVFAYGDAENHGAARTLWVPPRIADIASTPSGKGYALLDANGFVFAFGDAPRIQRAKPTARPAVAVAITRSGRGYWVLGGNGAITRYADAEHMGDADSRPVQAIDLARTVGGGGYWIATGSAFPAVPANSGDGRRIVYANRAQRIWLIEANGVVSHSYLVSGRIGAPPPGTYSIASKSVMSSAGSLRLPYMSRFYRASSGKWIGFHGIPLRPDGSPIQSDAQLGTPLSHGCVRMNQQDVKVVWDFAPVGTTVVVVA